MMAFVLAILCAVLCIASAMTGYFEGARYYGILSSLWLAADWLNDQRKAGK